VPKSKAVLTPLTAVTGGVIPRCGGGGGGRLRGGGGGGGGGACPGGILFGGGGGRAEGGLSGAFLGRCDPFYKISTTRHYASPANKNLLLQGQKM